MKNSLYISFYLLTFLIVLYSCERREVLPVDFGVTVENDTYEVGDTVRFHLTGVADYINFYSGERDNDYAYAYTNRINKVADISLSFTSEYYNGSQTSDLLRLYYSKDFSDTYSVEGIDEANWVDITDRCVFPEGISNGNNPLGFAETKANILDLFEEDDVQLHFAISYHARGPHTTYGQRTNARVSNFNINYTNDEGEHTLIDHMGADWSFVRYSNYDGSTNQFLIEPSRFSFAIAASPPVDRIAYAITKGISVDRQVNEGPDRPVLVKSYLDEQLSDFSYVFKEPGTYEVVFVVSNVYSATISENIYKINVKIVEE
ncbi:DUF5017 domain-containing protein [Sphingobacterium sp. SGG-5]|uniref:DUF5017 domain-containing protein n=1 Tax=Sphingobacterium sp. SGG-5 TaxID=2710881 RepID=UPI0013ED6C8F|nr:DUF5017 domain-containing protein [Sphingobacterium sp. SGG-5]NGM62149.1 DUF5017 domain-containing protein [Sphingobacterium sp. SGG-5]